MARPPVAHRRPSPAGLRTVPRRIYGRSFRVWYGMVVQETNRREKHPDEPVRASRKVRIGSEEYRTGPSELETVEHIAPQRFHWLSTAMQSVPEMHCAS